MLGCNTRLAHHNFWRHFQEGGVRWGSMIRHLLATSALRLELDRAPYVWYGVQYIDLVSLLRVL